jgi:WD40 repeat protein
MFSRKLVRSALVTTAGSVWLKRRITKSSPPNVSAYKHSSSVGLVTPVLSAAPITDSILATGDWFGTIDMIAPDCQKATMRQPRAVMAIAKLTDTMFATSEQSRVRLWDVNTQQEVRVFGPEQSGLISEMVGFPNGYLAVVRWGTKHVEIWDAHSGELKRSLSGHTGDVKYIAGLSHNRLASYGCDHTIRIWNLEQGECEQVFASGYSGSLTALPDDRLVTTNTRGISVWAAGWCVQEIKMRDIPWTPSLAVAPDGKLLITAFKNAFRTVDLETADTTDLYSFIMPDDIVCMPDGRVYTFGPGREMNCYRPIRHEES